MLVKTLFVESKQLTFCQPDVSLTGCLCLKEQINTRIPKSAKVVDWTANIADPTHRGARPGLA
ncbi:hypothetical protein CEXT_661431, partial [Caerostris extrusa]